MACLTSGIFLFEAVENIAYTKSCSRNFVSIGRSNAFTGCSHLTLAFGCLISGIKHAVCRHDKMGFLRDVQPLLEVVSTGFKRLCLIHKQVGSKHYAITNDIYLATLENT